jgi:chemotaxis response regulator CheB
MPKEAIALGAAEEVLPLDRIPQAILRWAVRALGGGVGLRT